MFEKWMESIQTWAGNDIRNPLAHMNGIYPNKNELRLRYTPRKSVWRMDRRRERESKKAKRNKRKSHPRYINIANLPCNEFQRFFVSSAQWLNIISFHACINTLYTCTSQFLRAFIYGIQFINCWFACLLFLSNTPKNIHAPYITVHAK